MKEILDNKIVYENEKFMICVSEVTHISREDKKNKLSRFQIKTLDFTMIFSL